MKRNTTNNFFTTALVGLYLIIAPLSLATQWEASAQLKIVRIGICMMGAGLALFSGALGKIGSAATATFVFGFVYVLAAAWSKYPLQGVAYKMIFLSAICFGLSYGLSMGRKETIYSSLRLLSIIATCAALITWYQYLRNPGESTRVGRLAIYGINANAIGMTAAGYLFFTVYSAINDKGLWRYIATGGTAILVLLLLATGSRAAIALAILGGTIQLIPWVRHPARLLVPAAMVTFLLIALSANLPVEAVERITDFEKNTRAGMWQAGIRLFLQEPVIGHGWLSSSGRSTGNLQNVYLQILAETGVVGGVLWLIAFFSIVKSARVTWRSIPKTFMPQYWLATAILSALAVHGIAESGLILGSTVNTFLFGFGLGLLENLHYESRRVIQRPFRASVELSGICGSCAR
jgi:O-antigen ligase